MPPPQTKHALLHSGVPANLFKFFLQKKCGTQLYMALKGHLMKLSEFHPTALQAALYRDTVNLFEVTKVLLVICEIKGESQSA
jgi:hypothetical protein